MSWKTTGGTEMRIASASHAAFAAVMIGLGVLGLIKRDFTMVWQPVPKGVPARDVLVYLCALVSIASGIGLLWRRTASLAVRVLLAGLVLWFLLWRVRALVVASLVEGTWSAGETMVMTAAAWVLFAWFATDWDRQRLGFAAGDKGIRIARVLYGLGLLPFGYAHFAYVERTAEMGPGWLPWHGFWACFTRGTFIATGVGGGLGGGVRCVWTFSSRALGLADGLVRAAGVGTPRGGGVSQRLPMGRGRFHFGVDGRRLGIDGLLPRHAVACCGQGRDSASLGTVGPFHPVKH